MIFAVSGRSTGKEQKTHQKNWLSEVTSIDSWNGPHFTYIHVEKTELHFQEV